MRRVLLTAAILLLVFTHFAAGADTRYIFNAGISYPLRPSYLNENWQIGFNLGFGLERKLNGPWHGQLYFDYNNFGISNDEYPKSVGFRESGISIEGGTASVLAISANLKRMMSRARSGEAPYLMGGLGIYRFSIADGSFVVDNTTHNIPSRSETTLGVNGGAGIDVRVGFRTSFYLEGRIFVGFTSEEITMHVPLRAGMIFPSISRALSERPIDSYENSSGL